MSLDQSPQPQYAPERSSKEKLWFLLLGVLAILGAAWFKQAVLTPWISELASSPNQARFFGIPNAALLFRAVLVGFPLNSLVFSLILVWRGVRILRSGQVPPPGERVFKRTAIRRGPWARFMGYAHFVPTILFLCLAAWGCWQAEHMVSSLLHDKSAHRA